MIFSPSRNVSESVREGSFAVVEHRFTIDQYDVAADAQVGQSSSPGRRLRRRLVHSPSAWYDVTTPRTWASTMARFTPEVNPKSSALTISRRTQPV